MISALECLCTQTLFTNEKKKNVAYISKLEVTDVKLLVPLLEEKKRPNYYSLDNLKLAKVNENHEFLMLDHGQHTSGFHLCFLQVI